MTYHIYYSIFERNYIYTSICFLHRMYIVELLLQSAYFAFPSCCNIIIIDKNYTFLNGFIQQDFIKIYSKTQ